MPNDNTSISLLAAYLGKKPSELLKNREFRTKLIQLIRSNCCNSSTTTTTTT